MCRAVNQCDLSTKVGFLQEAVGETDYDFLMLAFCESILEDEYLQFFFRDFDVEVMAALMKRFLNITFQPSSRVEIDIFDEDTRGKIVLKNYTLFEMGLNEQQLEQLQSHFELALRGEWLDEELVDECNERFDDLRKFYEMECREFEHWDLKC